MDCPFHKGLFEIYNQYVCRKYEVNAFAYSSDTVTISLTALLVWLRQSEGLRERFVSKMVKPKPSLLAVTVTQQGQDTGHHMELQQPQTRGPTYVLRSSLSAPTSLQTLKSPWGTWEWSIQTVLLFTGTSKFYLSMFSGKEMATHSSVLAWRIQGRGSLVGCRLWGHTESDTTEVT